ncbi:MAG TPA: RagB/SusD family nutrient uptake outer membrane protein [Chitinophagaceae bacterium]|nr:RagB/SusD family nutrient uptake outer membrane protein [Chitinophagaceae bacterium]
MTTEKYTRKTFIKTAGLGFFALLSACKLDEYNPTAGDATPTSFKTWDGLLVQCYSPLYDQLFSASDFLFMSEAGTDLWQNQNNSDWGKDYYYYEGLTTSTNPTNKAFTQLYSVISTCNTVINVADKVEGDKKDIEEKVGEAKCLRAFYYLILATHYGPVTLNLESAGGKPNLAPKRTKISTIYEQIIKDLKEAKEALGILPFNDTVARVTKKTAMGLLARTYAQGAGEDLKEDGKSYWLRAKEVAEDLITNAASYGAALYDDVEKVWYDKNNRDNKEALFIASGPVSGDSDSWNYASKSNKLFAYTFCDPNECSELVLTGNKQNYFYGRVNVNEVAASKYLIDCFDASWDKRWENSFTTAFGNFSMAQAGWFPYDEKRIVTLTEEICTKYGINPSHVGEKIYPYVDVNATPATYGGNQYEAFIWPKGVHNGDISQLEPTNNVYANPYPLDSDEDRFGIYLSKERLSKEDRAKRKYFCINIDDLFDNEGKYLQTTNDWIQKQGLNNSGYKLFPSLNKFNWSHNGLNYGSNLQIKQGDMFIMRMAEVYLIAAEAEQQLGNGGKAAKYLNKLRNRAVRAGASNHELGTATEQDVLDEYARELCGEFNRWAILKRHKAFETELPDGNPRAAASFDPSINYYRPISYDFLSEIENAEEYGDNGYGQTATSGLKGLLT